MRSGCVSTLQKGDIESLTVYSRPSATKRAAGRIGLLAPQGVAQLSHTAGSQSRAHLRPPQMHREKGEQVGCACGLKVVAVAWRREGDVWEALHLPLAPSPVPRDCGELRTEPGAQCCPMIER